MFIIPVILALLAVGHIYAWESKRKAVHLLPYAFLALSARLFYVEEGSIDIELFSVFFALIFVMHASCIWIIFVKKD